ncbi:MAG: DNA methyltransferase [Bacilli bacterium]
MEIDRVVNRDCLKGMRELEENSVDAVVCDPPYGISFMQAHWDHGVPGVPYWVEALRVAKPGAHLLAFGGTRTHHRLMVAIEDAGWELRDCLMWVFGGGLPKGLDLSKAIDKAAGAEREVVGTVRRWGNNAGKGRGGQYGNGYEASVVGAEKFDPITVPATEAAKQWDGWNTALKPAYEIVILAQKPDLSWSEGGVIIRSLIDLEAKLWSLLPASVAEKNFRLNLAEHDAVCGSVQWNAQEKSYIQDDLLGQMDMWQSVSVMTLCLSTVMSWRRTLAENLTDTSMFITKTGSGPTIDWRTLRLCVLALTPHYIIQDAIATGGSWQHASPAVKFLNAVCQSISATRTLSAVGPVILKEHTSLQGRGEQGLSPNYEPVILARKPLDGTVAETVLKWGCGGLNIDGCRIGTDPISAHGGGQPRDRIYGGGKGFPALERGSNPHTGRWPANLLLDDLAAELLDQQSGTLKSGGNPARRGSAKFKTCYGEFKGQETCTVHRGANSGGASRFFYCSKASKKERSGSLHPTVKPLNLMRYLCRLVTPPGGLILDPFMGSGSTAVAAVQEGFHIIGFEIDPGYHADACRRLAAALHPPEGVPGPATPTLAAFGVQNP